MIGHHIKAGEPQTENDHSTGQCSPRERKTNVEIIFDINLAGEANYCAKFAKWKKCSRYKLDCEVVKCLSRK